MKKMAVNSFPVFQLFFHETYFEKVDLLVSCPDERGVHVIGDSLEAAGDLLRVAVVHLLIRETPVAIS